MRRFRCGRVADYSGFHVGPAPTLAGLAENALEWRRLGRGRGANRYPP